LDAPGTHRQRAAWVDIWGGLAQSERVATVNVFLTVGFSHAITPIIVISAVATIIQQSFDIQGKTHGQESTVRGYHPANIGHLDV
jgi:hypothetical protein